MRLILEKIKKPRANSPTTLGINILKTYKLTNKLIWGSLFVENVNVIYKLHRNPVSKRIVEYFSPFQALQYQRIPALSDNPL